MRDENPIYLNNNHVLQALVEQRLTERLTTLCRASREVVESFAWGDKKLGRSESTAPNLADASLLAAVLGALDLRGCLGVYAGKVAPPGALKLEHIKLLIKTLSDPLPPDTGPVTTETYGALLDQLQRFEAELASHELFLRAPGENHHLGSIDLDPDERDALISFLACRQALVVASIANLVPLRGRGSLRMQLHDELALLRALGWGVVEEGRIYHSSLHASRGLNYAEWDFLHGMLTDAIERKELPYGIDIDALEHVAEKCRWRAEDWREQLKIHERIRASEAQRYGTYELTSQERDALLAVLSNAISLKQRSVELEIEALVIDEDGKDPHPTDLVQQLADAFAVAWCTRKHSVVGVVDGNTGKPGPIGRAHVEDLLSYIGGVDERLNERKVLSDLYGWLSLIVHPDEANEGEEEAR